MGIMGNCPAKYKAHYTAVIINKHDLGKRVDKIYAYKLS